MARTLVIAEAGVNHNGSLELAEQLVDIAAGAGADVVKFQTFRADRLATREAPKAAYQEQTTGKTETQHDMLRRLELSENMHRVLIERCRERGIDFMSTAFDVDSIDLLTSLGLDRFKIPSGEITNLPYLRKLGALKRQLILSTGMSSLDEIAAALDVLERAGTPRSDITVLHCHTEYPTAMRDVNLRAMQTIAETFGIAVGYSDHTPGIEVPLAAVALGASVIEKHFTLDRTLPGPDHRASLEPNELTAMVAGIRHIEEALGDGVKKATHSEEDNRRVVRKSIVAVRAIRAGETFTEDNLTTKRPGTGLSPMRWDEVIGRSAPRAFSADELIEL